MKTIDFENHFYVPDFFEVLSKRTVQPYYDPETDLLARIDSEIGTIKLPQAYSASWLMKMGQDRVDALDEWHIDRAILSPAPGMESIADEDAIKLSRAHNDALAELCREFPDRFLGTAALPVYDVDESVKEIERCVKELGFVGFHTHSNYGPNGYIDDDKYKPILRKCAELGAYVYIHPIIPYNPRYWEKYGSGFGSAALGFTMDTATTLAALVVSGIFDECPDLHVLVGHLGEGLPFYLKRTTNAFMHPMCKPQCKNEKPFDYYFKNNIWVTTSGTDQPESLYLAKKVLGIDRILIGTDYPFGKVGGEIGKSYMMEFLESLDLTPAEREAIYFRNAEALLGREL